MAWSSQKETQDYKTIYTHIENGQEPQCLLEPTLERYPAGNRCLYPSPLAESLQHRADRHRTHHNTHITSLPF